MRRVLSIFLFVWIGLTVYADDYSNCFIPGEVVEYKVSWAALPLAWARISTETITENGHELIRIRMVSKNYKVYSHIYKIDDVTEIIIDPETALPLRHDLILNEGTIHKSHQTTFLHDQGIAIFQDRISKDIREVPIESHTQDIFSFIYSKRNQDIKVVASKQNRLLVEGKLYDLAVAIHAEEDIRLPAYGKVPSIEVDPIAEFDGIFLRKGKIMFWVSKETPRMITCIRAKVPVGKISIKLTTVSGSGNNFWNHTK